jgi:lipopolysaccharide biosynthesis protein
MDLAAELLDRCQTIPDHRLLINTDEIWKAKVIELLLQEREEHDFELKIFANRGRDIAPMLLAWKDEILNHDLLIHCHTKKSSHSNIEFGQNWRRSLLAATFPAAEMCLKWQLLLSEAESGLIMPWPHHHVAHNANWGHNFARTKQLMSEMGWILGRDTFLYFPAGSFFWANVNSLRPLFNLGLRHQDFAPEPLPPDGCLAHALERCIGLVPMMQNHQNYAAWMGDSLHSIEALHPDPCLVELPRQRDLAPHSDRLFSDGMRQAFSTAQPVEQAIPLGKLP